MNPRPCAVFDFVAQIADAICNRIHFSGERVCFVLVVCETFIPTPLLDKLKDKTVALAV